MRAAVVLFAGINRDQDMIRALERFLGEKPVVLWQDDCILPEDVDLIVIPGGFSYGDYLRPGAIAARTPVMLAVAQAVQKGVRVLGVCNGFQILVEAGILPGALIRNRSLRFACKTISLEVCHSNTFFTKKVMQGTRLPCPIAHGDGCYYADEETLNRLEGEGRVVFRYAEGTNPNGSLHHIAGIVNEKGNVLGLMPHPENRIDPLHGGEECRVLFESLLN